ncbi:MAG: antitoxin Xre/MbcA/ParS toxin-binding domain-containing protein [Burkholderiales bacterium]
MPPLTAKDAAAGYALPAARDDFWSTHVPPARRGRAANSAEVLAASTSAVAPASKAPFRALLDRVDHAPQVQLFAHVEDGVPASVVDAIAQATGYTQVELLKRLGVPTTTLKRKSADLRPLPAAQGHRVVGFLSIAAKLKRLLEESGDAQALRGFDPEGWLMQWMDAANPALGGRTPFEMLKNPVGQRIVEDLLERMRSGVVG